MGEESNSSLAENMEIKDFELPDVKEEISSASCEEMDVSGVCVKEEEVHSDESSELNKSPLDSMKSTLLEPCEKEGQECLGDGVTPFCFVRIKTEEPDERDASCDTRSERSSFAQECPTNPEKDCSAVALCLKKESSAKLNTPSYTVDIKKETEESVDSLESGAQTNDDASVSGDVSNELGSSSVMNRNDMGHSSHEFIRGIECQQFPILCVKREKEKTTETHCVLISNKTASNACGSSRRGAKGIEEARSVASGCGPNRESLNCTLGDAEMKTCDDVRPSSGEDGEDGVERGGAPSASDSLYEPTRALGDGRSSVQQQQQHHVQRRTRRSGGDGLLPPASFACDTCGVRFRVRRNLANHARTHTGEKPFACGVCGASFGAKSSLVQHTRTHTGERPFACDTCGARFRDKRDLVKHARAHTGERPFACGVCGAGFSRNSTLAKHRRIHTGERPFACGVCGAAFTQKSHAAKHARIHDRQKALLHVRRGAV